MPGKTGVSFEPDVYLEIDGLIEFNDRLVVIESKTCPMPEISKPGRPTRRSERAHV